MTLTANMCRSVSGANINISKSGECAEVCLASLLVTAVTTTIALAPVILAHPALQAAGDCDGVARRGAVRERHDHVRPPQSD